MIIRNHEQLLAHGNIAGRQAVLDILEAGMAAADPYENVRSLIRIEGGKLIVGNERFRPESPLGSSPSPDSPPRSGEPLVYDLAQVGHIYVAGAGKAAQRMAQAIEDVLGDRITEGHVNAKKGDTVSLKRIEVTLAGHPFPDEDSVAGARRILEIRQKARRGDIVFLPESGGATSLSAMPAPGITLRDLQEVYRLLYFACGAPMPVANAVRNLLTVLRGKYARYAGEATVIQITTVEEPPRLRTYVNDRPAGLDPYQDAIYILKQYGCWDAVSEDVRRFLLQADPAYAPVRPDEPNGKRPNGSGERYHFRAMGPEVMLEAARQRAVELGLHTTILASSLNDIEARPAGEMLAYVAQEIEALDRPLPSPGVILCGGEVVVATGSNLGRGGRNQEFVLATAARIAGSRRIVIASADSDGSDALTDVAGGVVDGETLDRAKGLELSIPDALRRHDSNTLLAALGDTIATGILRTNVRDLRVIYVGRG